MRNNKRRMSHAGYKHFYIQKAACDDGEGENKWRGEEIEETRGDERREVAETFQGGKSEDAFFCTKCLRK